MHMAVQSLVTIAIPAYKRHWLSEAIESALAQDYSNIELLIVDDHSPQNLKEVVEPYLADKRVKYLYNEKNLGKKSIVHNWNRCLELASGEFFVLLCDDDVLMPNFVSTLMELAEKYPQCSVFHGRREIHNMNNGKVEKDQVWPEYETCEQYMNNGGFSRWHTITEFMYRTDHIKNIKYYVLPMGWGSDDVSILRFMEKGGIASSQECIAMFRKSDEHISGTYNAAYKKAKARIIEYKFLKTFPYRQWSDDEIYKIIGGRVTTFLPYMTTWERIMILCQTPLRSFTLKSWIWLLLFCWGMKGEKNSTWN